ncbi:MAG TPA: hypothetical protein H9827_01765 [Candidatus Luteimonas excrementigallinarum]|nr:hypothetical protein [Candidatus Luteimonas excrementigallinarum]
MTAEHPAGEGRKTTPAGRDDDKSGYAERTPRDRDDARNVGKKQPRDPDDGGLDREPGDDADPASDE